MQTPPYPLQRAVRPQSLLSRATIALVRVIASLCTRVGLIRTTDGPRLPAKDTYDVARDYPEVAMRTDCYAWMTNEARKGGQRCTLCSEAMEEIGRFKSIPDSNSLTNISSFGKDLAGFGVSVSVVQDLPYRV